MASTKIKDSSHNIKILLYWIAERQRIWWRRYHNQAPPWSDDRVMQRVKFTNVYRVLDRSSQDLINRVIYNGRTYTAKDMLFRIILYKHFNTPRTWTLLTNTLGDITADTRNTDIIHTLQQHKNVYNKAYMLCSSFTTKTYPQFRGMDKYHAYLHVFRTEIFDNKYYIKLLQSTNMQQLYKRLLKITGMGTFIAMQHAIDFNYSPLFNFSENDFIKAGLGAVRGINRIWENPTNYEDIIHWTHENLRSLLIKHADYLTTHYNVEFMPLPGRWPTVVDIHNCYCEVGKYLKVLHPDKSLGGEKQISHRYYPSRPITGFFNNQQQHKAPINHTFPPDWEVNLE